MRQALILLCESHFAILYILQLNLVSKALEQKGSLIMEILSQLGKLVFNCPFYQNKWRITSFFRLKIAEGKNF